MSLITLDSLIWVSSSSFSARCFSRVRSWTRVRRYRHRSRSSRCHGGGTNDGPQHPPLGQLGQPDRIQLVRLRPAGDVLDVAGVDHPALACRLRAGKTAASSTSRWPPSRTASPPGTSASPAAPAAPASSWRTCAPPAAAAPACPRAAPARTPSASPCRYPARPPASRSRRPR